MTRPLAVACSLAALLAGCLAPAETLEPAALALILVAEPVAIDARQSAREPAIAVAPDGTLFVSAFWGAYRWLESPPDAPAAVSQSPLLWRSRDGGASWERVDVGTPLDGAVGNSDVDLAVAPDGTVYLAALTFLSAPTEAIEPIAIAVGASPDGGESWTWRRVALSPRTDRPWVRVAPDGGAHVVWNDGAGVRHASSADRGASWTEGPRVSNAGGDGGFDAGPQGELAVRLTPRSASGEVVHPGVDGVAVSTDGGASWRYHALPGERGWPATPDDDGDGTRRWAEPVAFDAAGTLLAAWIEGERVMLARSFDLAQTWSVGTLATEAGGAPVYPIVRALTDGSAAVTWFSNLTGEVAARLAVGTSQGARVATLDADLGGSTSGEYLSFAALADGRIAAAVPVARSGAPLLELRVASFA